MAIENPFNFEFRFLAIYIASQKKAVALQELFRHGSNLSLPEEIPCLRLCENV
jgi:hypothetical protein